MAELATREVEFQVYRYDPEIDVKPRMQSYHLNIPEHSSMMVLGAIEKLKELDPSISVRRSCAEGVCGSDGMNINGKNRLACITPVVSLKGPIVLRPLPDCR